ncbi:MAG: hypothetical protein ACTS4V_01595 [Candidatus Hodgkinia cicadicola]
MVAVVAIVAVCFMKREEGNCLWFYGFLCVRRGERYIDRGERGGKKERLVIRKEGERGRFCCWVECSWFRLGWLSLVLGKELYVS